MFVAEYVLSETDPARALTDDQRWAAGLYGKVREHSNALRTGVCETLVMLAVHGNALFHDRLGIDVERCVVALVERLLDPFTSDKLLSHDRDLPGYAEAAPREFLALVEEDLGKPEPVLQDLLKPARAGIFDSPARTGVLWALERLAWNPRFLVRVVHILARLSKTKIDDNWLNKPMNSLSAIFRSWLPQTAASLEDRVKALEVLCRRFPDIGWQVCLHQLERGDLVGYFSDRPRWRNDAAGAGRTMSPNRERYEFCRKALDLALEWPTHDGTTLGDLVGHLDCMVGKDRLSVWNRVDVWSQIETDSKAREKLRERIRLTVLTRAGRLRGLLETEGERARQICEKLASRDPVVRHGWLFVGASVEISVADDCNGHIDLEEKEKRIHQSRKAAMAEIWSSNGAAGAFALLANCDGWTVGRYTARCAVEQGVAIDVLRSVLSNHAGVVGAGDDFMRGFLWFVDEPTRSALISTLAETCESDQVVRLFTCAPFRNQTWRLLDRQDRNVIDRYWLVVIPISAPFSESETAEIVDGLLKAGRPQAAFDAVAVDWTKVETSRLKRLLAYLGSVHTGRRGDMEDYYLSEGLESLGGRPGITVDDMARLEFVHIDALNRSKHGIPNLERRLAKSAGLFVRVLAFVFKRGDGGEDPPEWRVDDGDPRVLAAYRLLKKAARIPGTDPEGKVDVDALRQWIADARRLCSEHGRTDVGDRQIGQLLSRAPFEEDGSWPCRSVRDVMEAVASPEIASGFEIGVYNGRNVVSRSMDEGGAQERALSGKYRAWARRLAFDYPYVADILERIAKGYDRDAEREDSEVQVWNRLHH